MALYGTGVCDDDEPSEGVEYDGLDASNAMLAWPVDCGSCVAVRVGRSRGQASSIKHAWWCRERMSVQEG